MTRFGESTQDFGELKVFHYLKQGEEEEIRVSGEKGSDPEPSEIACFLQEHPLFAAAVMADRGWVEKILCDCCGKEADNFTKTLDGEMICDNCWDSERYTLTDEDREQAGLVGRVAELEAVLKSTVEELKISCQRNRPLIVQEAINTAEAVLGKGAAE